MKALFLLALLISITGCEVFKNYQYVATMTPSTPGKSNEFENDSIKISMSLYPEYLKIRLTNKLNDAIKINWDDVALSVNGYTYRVIHSETAASGVYLVQPPMTIPPRSFLDDKLTTTVGSILPGSDLGMPKTGKLIMSLKGSKVMVYLPIIINNKVVTSLYELTITDVKESKEPGMNIGNKKGKHWSS
jgi:hypothetical protein